VASPRGESLPTGLFTNLPVIGFDSGLAEGFTSPSSAGSVRDAVSNSFHPIAQIACEFRFEASHQLRREDWSDAQNNAVFGNCARLHGHSYRLVVTLRGPIDPETGMVMNFQHVKRLVRERVISRLDHFHLNDVVGGLTTAENLLYWIADQLLGPIPADLLARLELGETATCCAFLADAELQQFSQARARAALAIA
jgi:6-pyruvoyltetrahydropterin/6-carboxytetrahydropterin synthase